jgi:hypothetical protein
VAGNSNAGLHLLLVSAAAITQISELHIDGFDARSNIMTSAAGFSRQIPVFFVGGTAAINMVHNCKIYVHDVWLAGRMSYSAVNANGYGAAVLFMQANSGAKEIIVADSYINMNTGTNGMAASGTNVLALARIAEFVLGLDSTVTLLSVTGCALRGRFQAAGTGGAVELYIVRTRESIAPAGASDVLSLTDN